MAAVSSDQKVEEPSPEGLERSHLNTQLLEEFAQTLSGSIMESLRSQTGTLDPEVDQRASTFDQRQETLAEAMASAVIQAALREVFSTQSAADHMEASQSWKRCDSPSQAWPPVPGSLDYPDAPPTTPLLPELERSRYSFARKLKGGLARVYLPSPPPPTPKDEEDAGTAGDPRVELMEHLMRSLSTDDLTGDHPEAGSPRGAKVEALADAVSCDIIGSVLRGKSRETRGVDDDLHVLARQLAQTIITSSLHEAKTLL
ncbi:uncharacterized protein si:dkey-171c9.3 [Pungitius pungitius]|uniref:uncharacterized protein si:dkey-171c9.3 n=1 Tax=Pungitius pungitius TaxID=134920 RepID=UPI002E0FABED